MMVARSGSSGNTMVGNNVYQDNMSHAVIMNFHCLHHDNKLIGITESITNLLYPVKTMLATAGYVENGHMHGYI